MTDPCPYCSGTGVIKSAATICYEILDEVRKVGAQLDGPGLVLRVNPEIAKALREEESAVLRELQTTIGKTVSIKADLHLHHEQFDVMAM
jgi:ribonuclease G